MFVDFILSGNTEHVFVVVCVDSQFEWVAVEEERSTFLTYTSGLTSTGTRYGVFLWSVIGDLRLAMVATHSTSK